MKVEGRSTTKGAQGASPIFERRCRQQTSNLATATSFYLLHLLHPAPSTSHLHASAQSLPSTASSVLRAKRVPSAASFPSLRPAISALLHILSRTVRVASASTLPGSNHRPQQLPASYAAVSRWSIACSVHCRGEKRTCRSPPPGVTVESTFPCTLIQPFESASIPQTTNTPDLHQSVHR